MLTLPYADHVIHLHAPPVFDFHPVFLGLISFRGLLLSELVARSPSMFGYFDDREMPGYTTTVDETICFFFGDEI